MNVRHRPHNPSLPCTESDPNMPTLATAAIKCLELPFNKFFIHSDTSVYQINFSQVSLIDSWIVVS